MSAALRKDTSRVSADTATMGEDISEYARKAVEAIRQIGDDLAAKAGVKTGEAVNVMKSAANSTADSIGSLAGEAGDAAKVGLDAVGRAIVRNPLTALGIAVGAGLLLVAITRPDHRR